MEERRNYVIYIEDTRRNFVEEKERVVLMTTKQADAIRWFIDNFNINGCVELVENYEGEEI